jgi:hypothetical protein
MIYSPPLSKPARLRKLLESAERLAKEMQSEVPMSDDAYDALDSLLDVYLGENCFQVLACAEDFYNEYEQAEARREYAG